MALFNWLWLKAVEKAGIRQQVKANTFRLLLQWGFIVVRHIPLAAKNKRGRVKKNLALSLVGLLGVMAVAAYFLKPHTTIGDWDSTDCEQRLSIFRDKTAIQETSWGKNLCEWSSKSESLIVLKCRIAYTSNDAVHTFDSAHGKAGILDNKKVFVHVDANKSSCPSID